MHVLDICPCHFPKPSKNRSAGHTTWNNNKIGTSYSNNDGLWSIVKMHLKWFPWKLTQFLQNYVRSYTLKSCTVKCFIEIRVDHINLWSTSHTIRNMIYKGSQISNSRSQFSNLKSPVNCKFVKEWVRNMYISLFILINRRLLILLQVLLFY